MSIVALKGRKHLSADALFRLVRSGFARIPDCRSDNPEISFTDALMSAFAMFSLTSPSLLAFDQERTEGSERMAHSSTRLLLNKSAAWNRAQSSYAFPPGLLA